MPDRDDVVGSQPLILTLKLDDAAQAFYEDLRRRYFPPERNLIPAHLTLFHQLRDEAATREAVEASARSMRSFPLIRPAARSIGRGVAVFFEAAPLVVLHASLSAAFQTKLSAQDRQRIRPHIVVENKVDSATAQETLAQVGAMPLLEPMAAGLTLWRYLGGPWEHVCELLFA